MTCIPELLYARAMNAERLDNLALMEQDLRNILDRDPDNATALNALGYTLADRTDRYDEAYALIVRANELKPNDPAITDSLGWALYRLGRYDEAIELLTRPTPPCPTRKWPRTWAKCYGSTANRPKPGHYGAKPSSKALTTKY